MDSFLLALQFLTVFPLRIKEVSKAKLSRAMIYFPVVGLILGFLLVGINAISGILNFSGLTANILVVVALITITGGMHLDGLSDTADAFFSGKPKEEMLTIMRDSHSGVMGVLSLISIILLKVGLLGGAPLKAAALLLICSLSRWSAVLTLFLFPYARSEGKAKAFAEGINAKIFFLSTILAIIFALGIWRLKGLAVFSVIAGCTYLFGKATTRKLGGITGGTLGANIAIMEVISLFIGCII